MNSPRSPGWTPTPELLAAFADGELDQDPALRCRVEVWLRLHPEAEILDAQRELSQWLSATAPAEPDQQTWNQVLTGIEHGLSRRPPRWPAAVWIAASSAVAAALMLLVYRSVTDLQPAPLAHPPTAPLAQAANPQPALQEPEQAAPNDGAFHLVRQDEVEIVQVAGADASTVMVGQLPLTEPMILLQAHEVEVIVPQHGGVAPEIRMGAGTIPIAWMPLPGDDNQP